MSAARKTALGCHPFIVSRFFYEEAFKHFPILKENFDYRVFFWYVCFGTHFDTQSSNLLLCRDRIADLLRTNRANFDAGNFLAQFAHDVLGEENFRWTRWREGHCRQLLKLKLGSFNEILQGEYEGRWDNTKWISLDGEKWSAAQARHARKVQRELTQRFPTDCRQAEFIQNYLNHIPCNGFTKIVATNYRATYQHALNSLDERQVQRELRLLTQIRLQPQPFYSASAKGNTSRLFTGGTIPNLSKEIRQFLTQGWRDADLRASQLAICAWAWKIDPILDLLRSKKSVWEHLFSFFDLPETLKPEAKAIFKKTLYSICYGMEKQVLKWSIMENSSWRPLGRVIAARFVDIPLIQELLKARNAATEQVIHDGGATNCYNKVIKISEQVQAPSILAQIAQSWEMKLVFPAFELASRSTDFHINLFQYDGFSVHFRRRENLWRSRISDAVNAEAARLGIPTWLEWEEQRDPNQLEFPFAASI